MESNRKSDRVRRRRPQGTGPSSPQRTVSPESARVSWARDLRRFSSGHKSLYEISHQLRQQLSCQAVWVTRGKQRSSLCESTGESWHIPAMAEQISDVTRAGDTLIGTMALALSAGASIRERAIAANHATGVAVGMIGTAVMTRTPLKEALCHAGG